MPDWPFTFNLIITIQHELMILLDQLLSPYTLLLDKGLPQSSSLFSFDCHPIEVLIPKKMLNHFAI